MKPKELALYVASLALFVGAIYAYFYESRSTNWLPVLTHPFRIYAPFIALIGLVFLVLVLITQRFSFEAKNKTLTTVIRLPTFMLAFLITGFMMKIVGEAVHELLGHGLFVILFGGQVTNFYISLLWPYELSYVRWRLPSATFDQMAWVIGGGILVSAIVSFSIQDLLLRKQLRWQFYMPLFWLFFWCYINAIGYLIIGGVSPFGDVKELIRLGVLTPIFAIIIGTTFFLTGFFLLSVILHRTLTTFLKEKTKWGMLVFWSIIPTLTVLSMIGRGMFHFFIVPFSFVPILLSYLLEFQLKGKNYEDSAHDCD